MSKLKAIKIALQIVILGEEIRNAGKVIRFKKGYNQTEQKLSALKTEITELQHKFHSKNDETPTEILSNDFQSVDIYNKHDEVIATLDHSEEPVKLHDAYYLRAKPKTHGIKLSANENGSSIEFY